MELDEKQRSLLSTVHDFCKTRRYHGVMPARVLQTCDADLVRTVFNLGYVAFTSITPHADRPVEGVVLTDKGLRVLTTQ
jgi:hypothetical protein